MRISIITVSYNAEDTIAQTIESVLNQTVAPYEYIIKDGGSTDSTISIAEGYMDKFAARGISFKIVCEKDNGIYDAMNHAIEMCTGDIVGMINADDWYEPEAVETVNKTFEDSPFDLFYADIRLHKNDNVTFVKKSRNRAYSTSRDWNHPTTFITREMYGKYSYKTETLHDDYDLILRMKKDGVRIKVVNEVLANFRMNGVSHERSIKRAFERAGIKYKIYRQNGYSPLYAIECYGVELAKLIVG